MTDDDVKRLAARMRSPQNRRGTMSLGKPPTRRAAALLALAAGTVMTPQAVARAAGMNDSKSGDTLRALNRVGLARRLDSGAYTITDAGRAVVTGG